MQDEWRVEVDLDDEEHGYTVGERLRAISLDDQTRSALGDRVIVTRDGPRMFVYTHSAEAVREAEQVIAGLIEQDDLDADVRTTRWHPDERRWEPESAPMPQTEEERRAEYERREAEAERRAAETGEMPYEVRVDLESLEDAVGFAGELEQEGMTVRRRWRHVLVGAPTEERAAELAGELDERAPEDSHVEIEAHDVRYPVFMLISPG